MGVLCGKREAAGNWGQSLEESFLFAFIHTDVFVIAFLFGFVADRLATFQEGFQRGELFWSVPSVWGCCIVSHAQRPAELAARLRPAPS